MTTTFEDILRNEGTLVYTNVGVSMMPLLRQGRDIMVIENVQDGRALHRLDSVLFRRANGQYVLHRIMNNPTPAEDPVYRICGDNTIALEPVRRSQIIGRLIAVERYEGRHISMNDTSYRIYSWTMWGLWPFRRTLRPIYWRLRGYAAAVYHRLMRLAK